MPLKNVRYRTVMTKSGKTVRLAFRGGSAKAKTGKIVEAKNLDTGATRHEAEFKTAQHRTAGRRMKRGRIVKAMMQGG